LHNISKKHFFDRRKDSDDQVKILLVNPNRSYPPTPPIALDYLGEFLRKKAYEVDILDLFFCRSYQERLRAHLTKEIKAVGISVRNIDDSLLGSHNFYLPHIKEITEWIQREADVPVILGGVGFSVMPEVIMEYCGAEFGIQGDGEEALPLLLDALQGNGPFTEVPNLFYRVEGESKSNETKRTDMESFPLPSRWLVQNEAYFQRGGKGNIETKRGCNRNCIYCVDPVSKGRTYRLRPAECVVDEIEVLWRKGINSFHFCDSEFNLPKGHAEEVCTEIIRRGLHKKVTWETFANPVSFSENLAMLMKKSGCIHVEFGADSGSDHMLNSLGKDFTVEDLENTARTCNKYDLRFTYCLLIGGPGETLQTLKETLRVMKSLPVQQLAFNIGIRVYPQTKLAQYVLAQGELEHNESLHGHTINNETFFRPVYYLSSTLGEETRKKLIESMHGTRRNQITTLREISMCALPQQIETDRHPLVAISK